MKDDPVICGNFERDEYLGPICRKCGHTERVHAVKEAPMPHNKRETTALPNGQPIRLRGNRSGSELLNLTYRRKESDDV